MFVILGAAGHVGSACVHALLKAGEKVLAVAHSEGSGDDLRAAGAEIAVADVNDSTALRAVLKRGRRAFLLNPLADVSLDTEAVERAQVASILAALDGAGLEKVVGESTLGAQPGERIGDLSILWELEQGLERADVPAAIQRGAYYYSNFDMQLERIRDEGVLTTMIPADLAIPMVSPTDLGRTAARLLREPPERTGITSTEGPKRYSANDVARIFADALGRDVRVEEVPRDQWRAAFREQGFGEAAADAYARMTEVSVDSGFAVDGTERGTITLEEHIAELAGKS